MVRAGPGRRALGSSQAMKAAWLDDMIGLVPPVAYLVAMGYEERPPSTGSRTDSIEPNRPRSSGPRSR
jgi:hypothetical protein